ncbi:MAG: glutamate racemase [Verrucomicrobia bacterium]|nr:glutamate racemase [Verrucomicrobiota bacterium]
METLHIGVFDSGVGGLTVLKELNHLLPSASYTYFGDCARCPYGSKSASTVIRYSLENAQFLLTQGVQVLVVACNTASSVSLDRLEQTLSIPVIGTIKPTIEKIAQVTTKKRIGVIATRGTVRSQAFQREIAKRLPEAEVFATACPLFVPLVEERVTHPLIIRMIIKESLAPLKKKGIDTLVLGCTHYPILESYIREEMGPDIAIINPGKACAEELHALKRDLPTTTAQEHSEQYRFFVSDDPKRFKSTGEAFLGFALKRVLLCSL